jgi:dTDP-4-amino-4,6-dideoxygalactose transaminase
MTLWPYHSEDEISAVADVLRSGKTNYWSGPNGQAFESEFAQYTGAKHALAVTNGTTALELALHGLDLPPGSEVIVPCRTFMATASAVVTAGCKPVLADIDATLNVTVETLDQRLTPNTAAVIVVHYAGLPCDMAAIMDWASKRDIYVIEDCAHAHGTRVNGQHVGTFGDVGCFSFCVGKIMSLGGEGGMVITNNETLHRRMGARRDHGRYQMVGSKDMTAFQWTVEEFGTNLRMTEMQSAIGRIQLTKLDGWVNRRNQIAAAYDAILGGIPTPPGQKHGRYMYMAYVDDRDRKMVELQNMGVTARLGGCPNIGREAVFVNNAHACPVADELGFHTLSLPVYPTLTDDDVSAILDSVEMICA